MTVRPPADTAVAEADLQQQVLDFLDGSSFGPAKGGKRIDTHASMVFLGADRALKIKRAVRLPFLDYSTLEKRKRACEEELKVNAGNAPELYRRVVAITRNSDGAFEIDGTGTPGRMGGRNDAVRRDAVARSCRGIEDDRSIACDGRGRCDSAIPRQGAARGR